MKLIAITCDAAFDGEAEAFGALFEAGLELLHFRKPRADEAETRRVLRQIDGRFRDRVVLHDRFELAPEFGLRGIHLNGRNPDRPPFLARAAAAPDAKNMKVFSVSRSCHSIEELEAAFGGGYDYMFLSPVFDSISKQGYGRAFTERQLSCARTKGVINGRVVALGGIDVATIPVVAGYGFGGAAVLGALWGGDPGNVGAVVKRFENLNKACGI